MFFHDSTATKRPSRRRGRLTDILFVEKSVMPGKQIESLEIHDPSQNHRELWSGAYHPNANHPRVIGSLDVVVRARMRRTGPTFLPRQFEY